MGNSSVAVCKVPNLIWVLAVLGSEMLTQPRAGGDPERSIPVQGPCGPCTSSSRNIADPIAGAGQAWWVTDSRPPHVSRGHVAEIHHWEEQGSPLPHLVLINKNNAGCFAKYYYCSTKSGPLHMARWVRRVYFIEVLISISDQQSTTPGSRLNRISSCRLCIFAESMRLLSHFEWCILPLTPLVCFTWWRVR